MRPAVLAWAAAVLGASKASGDSNTCSKDDWRQSNNRLGSKGSFGPLNTSETLLAALPEEDYDAKRCPPVYAVAVARHGSRYPSESKRLALLALWEARCGSSAAGSSAAGSSAATTRLGEWCRAADAVRTVAAATLAPRGLAEMKAWATRLLERIGDADLGAVATTSKERTIESCRAFVTAGWGPSAAARCEGAADDALLHMPTVKRGDGAARAGELAACDADAVLRPQGPGAWLWACDELLEEDAAATAAALLRDDDDALAEFGFDDAERRRRAAPLLRRIDAGLRRARDAPVVDVFFAHGSTLAPLLALIGFVQKPESGAARVIPFASRLVLERTSCGQVLLSYNDVRLAAFPHYAAWRAFVKGGFDD